ncbi:MAG: phage tail protein [Clostridioides difficile]|nr:phage tail protein [Clostridioides difficile]
MSEQFYTILTNIGKAKIANAISLGSEVNLVRFVVGDSNGSYYNPTEEQTELRRKVWETNAISVVNDEKNPNWIKIEAIIPGDVGGFTVREVGVFDDKNEMIAIGKIAEIYKPISENGSTKDVIIRMIMEVSNASVVTIKVDPTVMIATKKDIEVVEGKFKKITGDKNELVTKDKSNLVAAINEVSTDLGNIELTGNKVTIEDIENNYESGTVEGALKELAVEGKALDKRIDDNKDEINNLKLSVADGKSKIATSVSGKGVPTNGSDSFQQMADNIDSIIVRSPIAEDEIGVVQWEDGSYKGFKNITYSEIALPESERRLVNYFKKAVSHAGFYTVKYLMTQDYFLYASGSSRYSIESRVSKVDRENNLLWQYQLDLWVAKIIEDKQKNILVLHGNVSENGYIVTKLGSDGSLKWVKIFPGQQTINDITVDKNGDVFAIRANLYSGQKTRVYKINGATGEEIKFKDYNYESTGYVINYNEKLNYMVFGTEFQIIFIDTELEIIKETSPGRASWVSMFLDDDGNVYGSTINGVGKYDSDGKQIWSYANNGGQIGVNHLGDSYFVSGSDIIKLNSAGVFEYRYVTYSTRMVQFFKDNVIAVSGGSSAPYKEMYFYMDNFMITENILLGTQYLDPR